MGGVRGGSVSRYILPLFPITEAFALTTDVIAEESTDDEVMLWRQTCKRLIHDDADSVEALLLTEEYVDVGMPHPLYHVFYTLALEAIHGEVLIAGITGEEDHLPHTFLIFVNMIHQHLHIESLLNCFELFC